MTNNTPAASKDAKASASPSNSAPQKSAFARFVTPILALVAALGIGLFGGVLIGHATASTSATQAGGRTGQFPGAQAGAAGGTQGGGGAAGGRGGFTSGTIASIDGDTITLTLADGSTVKVTANTDTKVTTTTDSSVSDLKTGDTVTAIGAPDSSGNVTATTISEGQAAFGGGGFGGARPSGTAPATN